MIYFGLLVGIYAVSVLFLGVLGLFYKAVIIIDSLIFLLIIGVLFKKCHITRQAFDKFETIILILLGLQVIINLIGVLGPEIGFDALWYHLTLPKLYLQTHQLSFFPGSLLQYSGMPQLGEMFYIPALVFGNEITAKFIHFLFGILCCGVLYQLAKKYVNKKYALLIVLIFYSNLVVSWESISAYIDLMRTFFEILSLWSFVQWWDSKKIESLVCSGLFIGFVISTKLLGIGSFIILLLLLIYKLTTDKYSLKEINIHVLLYSVVSFLLPFCFFVRSYFYTGNPIYPFFTNTYPVETTNLIFSPLYMIQTLWELFTHLSDPISPIYMISIPLVIILFHKLYKKYFPLLTYCLFSILMWYITPQSGGGRFILPYLPAFSLLVGLVIREQKDMYMRRLLVSIAIIVSIITIGYRGVANAKFIHIILGNETKDRFLSDHLAFSLGDFYDLNGFFKAHIKSTDRVLLYGVHNLYYVNFPYIHSDWIKSGDTFNYIVTQNATPPHRFSNWKQIYANSISNVRLYNNGGKWETY